MNIPLSASRSPTHHEDGHNVLTIASGKGGVGKTVIAISLAEAMSRMGKQILLFDGDMGLANIDIQLGLTPAHDLGEVIARTAQLEEIVIPYAAGGFDIIAGQSGSGLLGALPDTNLVGLRQRLFSLAARYDRAILDLGAGIDAPVRLMTADTGTVLVVTTEEPTALTDAYAFIKLAVARRPDIDIRVIVNMAASIREGERTFQILQKTCENFLRRPVGLAGVVRRDDHIRDAIRHQTSLITRHPTCDAATDVEKLAAALL